MTEHHKNHGRASHGGPHTNPRAAAQYTRDLMKQGYKQEQARKQAAKWVAAESRRSSNAINAPDMSSRAAEIPLTYAPTPTSDPRPGRLGNGGRTCAAGWDQEYQLMRIAWGDGGPDYYYENITPQEWESFQDADSPGKWINAVGNMHNYGRIG